MKINGANTIPVGFATLNKDAEDSVYKGTPPSLFLFYSTYLSLSLSLSLALYPSVLPVAEFRPRRENPGGLSGLEGQSRAALKDLVLLWSANKDDRREQRRRTDRLLTPSRHSTALSLLDSHSSARFPFCSSWKKFLTLWDGISVFNCNLGGGAESSEVFEHW